MVSAQAAALPRAGSNLDADAPDLEQHLLGDFLGLGRISQHLPDHPVHRPGQLAVDQLERPVVAARHQGQQGGQVRLMFRTRVPAATGRISGLLMPSYSRHETHPDCSCIAS